jgi:Na+/proline symporter
MNRAELTRHAAYGLSLWFGTALIAVGVVVNGIAGWRHLLIRELDRGQATHSHDTAHAVTVAFLVALVGLAMALYLISVRGSKSTEPENAKEVSHVECRQQWHPSDSFP